SWPWSPQRRRPSASGIWPRKIAEQQLVNGSELAGGNPHLLPVPLNLSPCTLASGDDHCGVGLQDAHQRVVVSRSSAAVEADRCQGPLLGHRNQSITRRPLRQG